MKCIVTIIFSKPIKSVLLSQTFDTTKSNAREIAKRYFQDDPKIKIRIEVENQEIFFGSYLELVQKAIVWKQSTKHKESEMKIFFYKDYTGFIFITNKHNYYISLRPVYILKSNRKKD